MRTKQLLLRAILMLMAIVGCQTADAQTLVLHLSDGTTVEIQMNSKFRMANIGDITVVTMPDGNTVQYERNDIRTVTFKGGGERGDVNGDGNIDVADIGSVIDIMAGKAQSMGAYTKCPNTDHPHLIDLDLPGGTKWACCNVGALKPEDYGDYFSWGETKPKEEYSWATYTHCDGSFETLHDLGLDIAKTAYDAATVNIHSQWHMPTFEQLKDLYDNTTALWTKQNGVEGVKFTGKNGASIFLPAAGYQTDSGNTENAGMIGKYWSSMVDMNYSYRAYYLYISNTQPLKRISYESLISGLSVRPVAD